MLALESCPYTTVFITQVSNGSNFLIKYKPDGNVTWVEQGVGGSNTSVKYSLGRLYCSSGTYGVTVTSYDTTASLRWTKYSGNGNPNQFHPVDLSAFESDVVVSGWFEGGWTWDGHDFGT